MSKVIVYTAQVCPYCTAVKALLRRKNITFEEVDITFDPAMRQWVAERSKQRTVPQVFINDQPFGGYTDIAALDSRGELDRILQTTADES